MKFEPKPENDFRLFIKTYFECSRAECPKLAAIAGKWTFEDLIPGLSDFDTRFIFADEVTVEDWIRMSSAVGRVHTSLAKESPRWARMLEHLPGLNLTRAEMLDPRTYYPEFQQWTFYRGDRKVLAETEDYLDQRPWSRRDESFHLRKFAAFFGRYIRGIDPPVNIGRWENKYPLHSRFMHYFTPAVQAALSIVQRRGMRGKLAALREAKDVFPHAEVIDMVLEAVDRHYEIPEYYEEPRLDGHRTPPGELPQRRLYLADRLRVPGRYRPHGHPRQAQGENRRHRHRSHGAFLRGRQILPLHEGPAPLLWGRHPVVRLEPG